MPRALRVVLVTLLGCATPACSVIGTATGYTVGVLRQPDPSTPYVVRTQRGTDGQQAPIAKPMSVAGHTLIGGLGGLAIDVLVFSLYIARGGSDIQIGS